VFKKIISMMMVFSIFTVQAQATTQNGLKAAFDEMTYSITVEWDQKDKAFYEAQVEKFTQVVTDLQKQGMTNAELVEFAKSQVKDVQLAKELDTIFSIITINKMSSTEAAQYMRESFQRSYSKGASWGGEALLYLGAGLALVGLAIAVSAAGGGSGRVSACYSYTSWCWDSWGYEYPCYCNSCDYYCY
jgi:CheY-like chemotaxis protein